MLEKRKKFILIVVWKDGKWVKFVKDKLIIDGVLYNLFFICFDIKECEENNISGNLFKVIFWNINGGFLRKF